MLDTSSIRPGDLIGFSGRGLLAAFINLVTYGVPGWSLSHLGIVAEYRKKLFLFESTTLEEHSCAIRHQHIHGTQAHRLEERLAEPCGKVWHYPLSKPLDEKQRKDLSKFLVSTLGVPYDFVGAFRAGGVGFSWLESWLHPANLNAIFCGEWCAAAHAKIGVFQTDNVSRWNPNHLVRAERREGILLPPRRLK